MKNLLFLGVFLLPLWLSSQTLNPNNNQALDQSSIYRHAIQDAMYPDSSKVYNKLISITQQNKNLLWKNFDGEDYVLVVSWKGSKSYYEAYLDSPFYNTGNWEIWISTAPELLQRIKKEKPKDVDLRLKQLLGLPPNSVYNYFVEFWVRPADLFRPCPDNEITDTQCDICFEKNADPSYVQWINSTRIARYYYTLNNGDYDCSLYNKYPWTELGYTYDWDPKNKSHVGLSEFVIGKNKNIKVNAIYTTEEYLKK